MNQEQIFFTEFDNLLLSSVEPVPIMNGDDNNALLLPENGNTPCTMPITMDQEFPIQTSQQQEPTKPQDLLYPQYPQDYFFGMNCAETTATPELSVSSCSSSPLSPDYIFDNTATAAFSAAPDMCYSTSMPPPPPTTLQYSPSMVHQHHSPLLQDPGLNSSSPLDINDSPSPSASASASHMSSSSTSIPTPPPDGLDFNGRKPRKWRNRKYKCSHCSKQFLDKDLDLYAAHVEQVEQQKNGMQLTRRKYKCADTTCPWHKIGFLRKLEAQKHYTRKHGVPKFECRYWSESGEMIPGCGVCTTRWHADSGNRSRHEQAIHGGVFKE